MRNLVWVILLVATARAQDLEKRNYKFCAPVDVVTENSCIAVQRGNSEVSCLIASDSSECAIRLAEGKADFGVFNADELLLINQFYPSDIEPIIQLKHRSKQLDEFEFQMVAVIPSDKTFIQITPRERLARLKNNGFCHPGFSQSQWLNDYILKYFENTLSVNPLQCQDNVTAIENEIINLKNFFGKACRPGEWASDESFDQKLKEKYPELCALCDDTAACSYDSKRHHGHFGALQCLTQGRGKVAYVALQYVQDYLQTNVSYQFLCPDGSILPLSTPYPCAWLQQPWSVVAARKQVADFLKQRLLDWLHNSDSDWKSSLSRIIQEDSRGINLAKTTIAKYLNGREIDVETCGKNIRWCTIGDSETNKCKWVAKTAKVLGVAPSISCIMSNSTFQCFRDIEENRTDIVVIDSNYGYLARKVHNLSTILYSETEMDKNSVTFAVMREPEEDNYLIKNFQDLSGKKACFPEYGGLGWLSFINAARKSNIISSKSCDYPLLVSDLFSGACAPGIEDFDHSSTAIPSDVSSKLCSACKNENNPSCAVDETNRYYGDKGAIQCLTDEAGDIAFIEMTNITIIEPNKYRILCKNGSLAQQTGLNADEQCALSVTIDSEVVGRDKDDEQISRMDTILALLKLEDWLGYRVNARRSIHIYGPFNGTKNLLFKDSSAGLVSTSSTKESVVAYKDLLNDIEECSNGSLATANLIFIILVALYHLLSSHVH
ncbi:PREDICTED: transferrin-like [Trachymyrmex cornetzi]|uniref:Transferrin n=1 Tax=Trachymyrmex cornetzi TaxID=471704 RepID=A0A195E7T3_9HYME|nr:PREDICTED: transferrin-like [Trachymyrmex cornetzi]KYN20902.1 Transferrin [Trachymyrmex cornetzi]